MYTLGSSFIPPGIHAGGLRYHGRTPFAVGEIAVIGGGLDHAVQRDVFHDFELSHLSLRVLVFLFCWSYMGGAGVPSDHLGTITKKTAMGGKLLSCGYASADKYQ